MRRLTYLGFLHMRRLSVLGAALAALAIGGCGGSGTHTGSVRRHVNARARVGHRRDASTVSTASPVLAASHVVAVSYDGTECAPEWTTLKAGSYEFALQDRGNDAIAMTLLSAGTGVAISPTTPVQPGERASIRAQLRPGDSYAWRCQTSSQPPATSAAIRIPGHAQTGTGDAPAQVTTAMLYRPLTRYTAYVAATLAKLRRQLGTLDRRLAANDLSGAQAAWVAAHVSWLELGQDDGAYGAFGQLGNEIDGTAAGDVGTTASAGFSGFHRIEFELWRRHDVAASRTAAASLTKLVASITQQKLSQDLPAKTTALDAWVLRCHEILEDALRDTLSGNDDYGSHTALITLGADVTATREMLRVLGGLIQVRKPTLLPTVRRELAAIDAVIRPSAAVPIADLPERRRQSLDAAVGAALETLAPVSELLQVSSANS
jgi:high-affinity iron transporter